MQARPERKKEEQNLWPKRITFFELINFFPYVSREMSNKTAI
ncbi:hypothetical protein [Fictibacillus arsenicus]|nr:hypothetical protein [Fictibacillus arsenicus]